MTLRSLGIKSVKDGRSFHPLYNAWRQMLYACYDKGRGVVVKEWFDFWKFEADVCKIYYKKPGRIFCRKDSTKPFGPDNVKFANNGSELAEGRKNRLRANVGNKKLTVQEIKRIAEMKGIQISWRGIQERIKHNWDVLDKKYGPRKRKKK